MNKNSQRKKLVLVFAVLFIAWFLVSIYIGGKHQEQRLYKHGFRLLEEQIAVYIKEHYSGVSKVEFTDIYNYGDSGLYVYPIITDNHGNRTLLNDSINGAYGTSRGLYALEFHPSSKSEIIYLDEPLMGLDFHNKKLATEYIINNLNGRALVYTGSPLNFKNEKIIELKTK